MRNRWAFVLPELIGTTAHRGELAVRRAGVLSAFRAQRLRCRDFLREQRGSTDYQRRHAAEVWRRAASMEILSVWTEYLAGGADRGALSLESWSPPTQEGGGVVLRYPWSRA